MNPELNPHDIGRQLGADGVNSVVAKVEQYCVHEERRITLENHAKIVTLRAEFSLLVDEERRLADVLQSAPPPGDLRHHWFKRIFAWAFTIILTVSGFFLAALTFAPFRLGWQGYIFCLGVSTVVPFLVEKLLQDSRLEPMVKALTAIAGVAGIASLMLMADVRGHLLAHEVQSAPAVIIDDAQPEEQPQPNDFYGATLGSLCLATVLLSFAMELGAGLALKEAWTRTPHNAEDWKRLRGELAQVHRQMVAAAGNITQLEDEPASFHAKLWRDFYRSMLTHTMQSAVTKLLVLAVLVAMVPYARAAAPPQHTNLVIALDLTKSVAVKGPDGATEFQKNLDGVTHLLAEVSPGTHITVVGITDRSFAQPYILLSATVPDDPGYFGERLSIARTQLVRSWKQCSAKLEPTFASTDILGVFQLASQIFEQEPPEAEKRILVLFSDMRHHTRELDLESASGIAAALKNLKEIAQPLPDLRVVEVYALGVDAADESSADWQRVEEFWDVYVRRCGAGLASYSVLRGLPPTSVR